MAKLHEVTPRELVGRDTIERFNAQIKAASIACLSILDGKNVKAVYCEFHDDFVIEKSFNGDSKYLFVQVKTKGKLRDIWGVNDVFGILKRTQKSSSQSIEKIKNSFVGKLLQHTVSFEDECEEVIFMTNTHVDESIEDIINDIDSNNFINKHSQLLLEKFNELFDTPNYKKLSVDAVKEKLKKLKFQTDIEYIKNKKEDVFESLARTEIYKYSEIDLDYNESREILLSLLSLVNRKSSKKISDCSKESISECSGIKIDDLLEILSISKKAYYELLENGDNKAIKSASVIERTLRRAGASNDEIEFCSSCKIQWDKWVRYNRHIIQPIDFAIIDGYLEDVISELAKGGNVIRLAGLRQRVEFVMTVLSDQRLLFDLDQETIIGGIFSKLVGHEK